MVPRCLTGLHTKPSPDEYGLECDEGRVAEIECKKTLTRHIAIGRFLLLTKESMNILPEYPGALH